MRINTHLQVSRTKTWVHALLFLLVFLILVFSEMPVVVIALALTAMICMLAYQRFFQKASPHLVQLVQFDKQAWRWSVFDPNRINQSSKKDSSSASITGSLCWSCGLKPSRKIKKSPRIGSFGVIKWM
jgi:hypothetical protein